MRGTTAAGYILAWLMGVPLFLLVILWLLGDGDAHAEEEMEHPVQFVEVEGREHDHLTGRRKNHPLYSSGDTGRDLLARSQAWPGRRGHDKLTLARSKSSTKGASCCERP